MWISHPDFLMFVQEAMERCIHGTKMFQLTYKLKYLKGKLKKLHRGHFAAIHEKKEMCKIHFENIQRILQQFPQDPMLKESYGECV